MINVIITGILGQDGSNMAELLLDDPTIKVFGIFRRSTNPSHNNIKSIIDNPNFALLNGDITDQSNIDNLVSRIQPDYFINFAANSFVGTSWDAPEQVFEVNALGVLKCLESIRKLAPKCRFYSAGSSEEFGSIKYTPQDENHPLIPVSPYAAAKITARHLVSIYRESHGLYAIHGTLFNHEGPKRGSEFVTRKITKNIALFVKSLNDPESKLHTFTLGNIFTNKDWSDSRDMVRGIWAMLQLPSPKEFILASGRSRTIKEFVEICFKVAGINGKWVLHEDPLEDYFEIYSNGVHKIITIDPKLFRPTEVGFQMGDYGQAKRELGWEPEISFDQMVEEMLESDLSDE